MLSKKLSTYMQVSSQTSKLQCMRSLTYDFAELLVQRKRVYTRCTVRLPVPAQETKVVAETTQQQLICSCRRLRMKCRPCLHRVSGAKRVGAAPPFTKQASNHLCSRKGSAADLRHLRHTNSAVCFASQARRLLHANATWTHLCDRVLS